MAVDPDGPALSAPHRTGLAVPSPATVRGLPLQPGERVVYFHHTRSIGLRVLMFFIGIPLVPLLIGLVFLWVALTDQSEMTVITNYRFVRVSGKKPAAAIGLREIVRTESVHGLRNRLTEMRLFDATGRFLSVSFTSDENLRLLVRNILDDRSVVETMPAVPYEH